jgi:Putative sensor
VAGFVSFLVILIGVSVGIGTVPAALAGVLCFGCVLRFDEYFARFERARLGFMLGARLPGWPDWARAGYRWGIVPRWQTLSNRAAWSEFGYALVRFPVSFAGFVVILGAWLLGLAWLTLPLHDGRAPPVAAVAAGTQIADVTSRGRHVRKGHPVSRYRSTATTRR